MRFTGLSIVGALAIGACLVSGAAAADWPMGRYDAQRSNASPQALPDQLALHWARAYPPLKPAWPDQEKMQSDIAYEPVVAGQTLFLTSSRHDCIRALDTRTGAERWTFFADGPVRFAPVAWEGRLFFTSDDGYLYCLDAASGRELWKFRGGPSDRKVLGNDRLIATWPARGGPVIADDTVYFAASIWPFMGVFVHALDARTGAVVWTNDGDGSLYTKQPHHADSFAGVAPQGSLVVSGELLLVPGGRSVPACLDRRTGKLVRYQLAENGKRGGGPDVSARGDHYFNGGAVFERTTQKYLGAIAKQIVLTPDAIFTCADGSCRAHAPAPADDDPADAESVKAKPWHLAELAACNVPVSDALIKAGPRLYVGGNEKIVALDVAPQAKEIRVAWELSVEGRVIRLVAADERLFAITAEGQVYCFGAGAVTPRVFASASPLPAARDLPAERKAAAILQTVPDRAGYAVVWGLGDGRLLRALVRQSTMHFVVVEPRADRVRRWRHWLAQEDLYGTRIAILPGTPLGVALPPYMASLMVCEDIAVLRGQPLEAFLPHAFASLRPFGGVICLESTPTVQERLPGLVAKLPGATMRRQDELAILARPGPLPGSGNWTHENADAANTRVSPDQLVKAPLGLLWFGGPSHQGILPRHGHGPQPQVIDGRLIIEGVDLLRAIDVYTGRLLWEVRLRGVGDLYNNLAHQAGANATGGNFVCTSGCIYVAYKNGCVRLDPATGNKLGEFHLPAVGDAAPPLWGHIAVAGDYLIGGADPLFDPKRLPAPAKDNGNDRDDERGPKAKLGSLVKVLKSLKGFNDNFSSSRHLCVLDRHTGKVLWQVGARYGFRHNATCVGNGRLYTIDRLSGDQMAKLRLQDEEPPPPRLRVFDLKTGQELWSTAADVFGTWASYSAKHDVLIESGRLTRDSLLDEATGMRAYRGSDGKVLWYEQDYRGPGMIHGDSVLQGQGACDVRTGAVKLRADPITGRMVPWTWTRNHGCNTPAASEHLMTFRSGAAGYFDLCRDGGTGNFGGFRSSCTNNLIVAGGVLTVPEYTRTCTCAYQNQTSVGLVPMADAEMWTAFGSKDVRGIVQRLGLNFGAPGDRRADNGTLWLEYPSTGGISPVVNVKTKPADVEVFRRHPSFVAGKLNWVASSGLKGIEEVVIGLGDAGTPPRTFTVRLVFAEPDSLKEGDRVFDVAIEGTVVLKDFDIAREAGGPRRSLIKEFNGIPARGRLTVRLSPSAQARVRSTILCGIEIIAEKQ